MQRLAVALTRHRRNRRLRVLLAAALLAALALSLAPASPTRATSLAPFIDLQERGLTLRAEGVGLQGRGAVTRSLSVDIGGPVRAAVLYWAGQDRPCAQSSAGVCVIPAQPYLDQQIRFAGEAITGTIIGTEAQPATEGGPVNNIGYLADVTSIVAARGTDRKSVV